MNEWTESTRLLLENIFRRLVDQPDLCAVSVVDGEQMTFLVECAECDFGKAIGHKGKTIDSVRTILYALSCKAKMKRSVLLMRQDFLKG